MPPLKRKDKQREPRPLESAPPHPVEPSSPSLAEPGLSRRGWLILGAVLLGLQFPLLHYALLRGAPDAHVSLPYSQDFSDPSVVKRDFFSTGGYWRVVQGTLLSPGVRNNPLWLAASLPGDVAIEFDARSESPQGDIKVELFGDGTDHASGYVFIHGGWNNTLSVIARLDEHGRAEEALRDFSRRVAERRGTPGADWVATGVFKKDSRMRVEASPFPVEQGRTYRWRIERRGQALRWSIDGKPFMSFDDPFPLAGKKHDRFGFSSWDAQLHFDNLKVTAL